MVRRGVLGFGGGERGQTMVEFALALPILVLLILGAVDFSRLLLTYLAVSNGARDGARQGIVRPNCIDSFGTTANSIQAKIKNNTDGALPWTRVTPVVTYFNAASTLVNTPVQLGYVRVQVTASFEPATPLVGPIIGNPLVSAESQMVIEQVAAC